MRTRLPNPLHIQSLHHLYTFVGAPFLPDTASFIPRITVHIIDESIENIAVNVKNSS